jgi:hypothetical protein
MDITSPTPPTTETPQSDLVSSVGAPSVDPVYAPVEEAQPQAGYGAYGDNQPNTVAQQISSLGQAEHITPIVPLAHMVEEPVAPIIQPEPVNPVMTAPMPLAEIAVPVTPIVDAPAVTTVKTQSMKTLALLVLVFVVLFGLAAGLGYWLGTHS